MKLNRGILGFFAMALMMSGTPTLGSAKIVSPPQFGSGNGAGEGHWYSSPIYIPYKHIKQTYRSQQRAAKQRRKQR